MQSDSTFILENLLKELNVQAQPVKLKLCTMTAVSTILTSMSTCGLLIRGLYLGKHSKTLMKGLTKTGTHLKRKFISYSSSSTTSGRKRMDNWRCPSLSRVAAHLYCQTTRDKPLFAFSV